MRWFDVRMKVYDTLHYGAVILSNSQGGGYYLSNDPEELRRFTRTLNARAGNTIKAAQSAQMALDAAIGQERMEGWFDG